MSVLPVVLSVDVELDEEEQSVVTVGSRQLYP